MRVPDVAMTHIATCDLGGICRGRSVLSREVERWGSQGIGWVPSSIAMSPLGTIVQGSPFGPVGDLRLVPDLSTSTILPAIGARPAVTLVLGDLTATTGAEWACSTRAFLRAAVADLREQTGLSVRASFEHEFSILGLPHVQAPLSLSALRRIEPFGTHLVSALDQGGLGPETWHPEYGPNQWEITLTPADAVDAADRAILLREIVRHVAEALALRVTFSPTPHVGGVGNGVHVHMSLHTPDGSPSSTYDSTRPGSLSRHATSFAAGILRHAAALSSLTAPSPVSALRFGPGHWSVAAARAGCGDREALIRVCPPVSIDGGDPTDQVHLEYRGADATANPWIVMGALIRAGLDGIHHGWDLPDLDHTVPQAAPGEPMPSSLTVSLDALTADHTAWGWFPPDLADTYLAVKRDEVARTDDLTDEQRVALYTDLY